MLRWARSATERGHLSDKRSCSWRSWRCSWVVQEAMAGHEIHPALSHTHQILQHLDWTPQRNNVDTEYRLSELLQDFWFPQHDGSLAWW